MTTLILDGIWGLHARWEPLRCRIASRVGPARIWHYNNSGLLSLESLGSQLAAELRRINGPFHLVGYSMGGLIIREALRQDPTLPLQRSALLHSPHSGSLSACLLPLTACREMRPGSLFLRRLAAAAWDFPTLVTWSPGDLMILPGSSARWTRASRILRSDIPAHAWPVVSQGIHRSVIDFLDPATRP